MPETSVEIAGVAVRAMPPTDVHYPAIRVVYDGRVAKRVEVDGVPWAVMAVDLSLGNRPTEVILRLRPRSLALDGGETTEIEVPEPHEIPAGWSYRHDEHGVRWATPPWAS